MSSPVADNKKEYLLSHIFLKKLKEKMKKCIKKKYIQTQWPDFKSPIHLGSIYWSSNNVCFLYVLRSWV